VVVVAVHHGGVGHHGEPELRGDGWIAAADHVIGDEGVDVMPAAVVEPFVRRLSGGLARHREGVHVVLQPLASLGRPVVGAYGLALHAVHPDGEARWERVHRGVARPPAGGSAEDHRRAGLGGLREAQAHRE